MKKKDVLSTTVTQSACIFRIIKTVESLFTRNDENGRGEYNSEKDIFSAWRTYGNREEEIYLKILCTWIVN